MSHATELRDKRNRLIVITSREKAARSRASELRREAERSMDGVDKADDEARRYAAEMSRLRVEIAAMTNAQEQKGTA